MLHVTIILKKCYSLLTNCTFLVYCTTCTFQMPCLTHMTFVERTASQKRPVTNSFLEQIRWQENSYELFVTGNSKPVWLLSAQWALCWLQWRAVADAAAVAAVVVATSGERISGERYSIIANSLMMFASCFNIWRRSQLPVTSFNYSDTVLRFQVNWALVQRWSTDLLVKIWHRITTSDNIFRLKSKRS